MFLCVWSIDGGEKIEDSGNSSWMGFMSSRESFIIRIIKCGHQGEVRTCPSSSMVIKVIILSSPSVVIHHLEPGISRIFAISASGILTLMTT